MTNLRDLMPELRHLRDIGAAGLFPGLSEGIDALEGSLPAIERIVAAVSGELGDIAAEGGASLAGPRWSEFFTFVEDEAPQALADMAHGVGNVTHAMAELWMAFSPLNRSMSSTLVDATAAFDDWAEGLSQTQGFGEFVDYIESTGPQVASTLGSIANAVLQIVEATAPLGGPVLKIVGSLADALASFADSDLGTPLLSTVAAMSALSLATRTWGSVARAVTGTQTTMLGNYRKLSGGVRTFGADLKAASTFGYMSRREMERSAVATGRLGGQLRTLGKGTALMGGLALATTGAADSFGLANTASLGLMGFGVGGPVGAAVGAGAGAMLDLAHSTDSAEAALTKLNQAMRSGDAAQLSTAIADAKKELDDFGSVTGFGDFFSDQAKNLKGAAQQIFTGHSWADDLQLGYLNGTLEQQSKSAAASQDLLSRGFSQTAAGARAAAMSVEDFNASVTTMEGLLSKRAGMRDYQAALDDFTAGLKENGKTLDINTAAGRANQANLDNIAATAIKMGSAMQLGSARQQVFLDKARAGFIRAAVAAGMGRGAARHLADQLISVDRLKVNPKIDVNTRQAMGQVRALKALILDATKPRTGSITIRRRVVGGGIGALLDPNSPNRKAGGGQVYAALPGETRGPRDDTIPAALSHREWVMPVAAVDHYGEAFMSAIQHRAYADGGQVASWHHYARGGQARRHKGAGSKSKTLEQAMDRLREAVDGNTSARDDLTSKRNDLASTVGGNFLSDPFATSNVWAAGGGYNPLGALRGDIAGAKAFQSTLAKLRANGVSGQALATIAATGDRAAATNLLSLGASGGREYTSLYNQRAAAANAVGMYAGNSVYGGQIAQQNKELIAIKAELKKLNAEQKGHHKGAEKRGEKQAAAVGHHVSKGVNTAASAAAHRKRRHG